MRIMEYPNLREEKKLWGKGYKVVVGLDEAGRGPLAGPVVAAAVCIVNSKHEILNSKQNIKNKSQNMFRISDLGFRISDLRDSKELSEKKREFFYHKITSSSMIGWGVGIVSEKVIDKINILEATKLAMLKALRQAQGKTKRNADFLLLDGNFKISSKIPQKSIIKADKKVFSCCAAGIIAKVTRDRLMKKYDKKYPAYGFSKHKGYGTKFHIEKINKLGVLKIHRRTFWPVKSLTS